MQRFTDDFEKREYLGREALKELQLQHPDLFKYQITFTTEKYSEYDAMYIILDDNQQITKRVWIELKIRDTDYDDGYILETKKLNSLIKKRKSLFLNENEVVFLYINFTPTKTIIWNVTNLEIETKTLKANKATSDSRTNKINKSVLYLTQDTGRTLDYILNDKHLLTKYDTNYLLPKVKAEIKKRPGLEDILFM
jgi:hypothetical protein